MPLRAEPEHLQRGARGFGEGQPWPVCLEIDARALHKRPRRVSRHVACRTAKASKALQGKSGFQISAAGDVFSPVLCISVFNRAALCAFVLPALSPCHLLPL